LPALLRHPLFANLATLELSGCEIGEGRRSLGARVSVDTVYKNFGGKPGLVRAICEQGLAGEQPVHAEARSDALQAAEGDPRAIIRGWGALTTEIARGWRRSSSSSARPRAPTPRWPTSKPR
jgi:AcrR family transcriptional regulator